MIASKSLIDQATPTHLRRAYSSILTFFSWSWDGIVSEPQDFEEVAQGLCNKNFLISWKAFETSLLSLNGDLRFEDTLRALDIQHSRTSPLSLIPSDPIPLDPMPLSVFDYQKLCNVLAGYKYAELLVLRENNGARVLNSAKVNDICLPPSTNLRNTPHGFERLRDWTSVIHSFKTAASRSTLTPSQADTPNGCSRLLLLMRLLVRSENKSHYVNAENNFLYAALHVYALNNGIFPEGIIPNLPGEQKNMQIQFFDHVSQQEYAEVSANLVQCHERLGGNSGHASLCAPFHLALFISPIYLLFPFRIVKQSFHRRSVIEVSHRLGPHKPSTILNIERLIWDAVFAIAERPLDIQDILVNLALQIPGTDLVSCSPEEKQWFSLSNDLSRTVQYENGIQHETARAALMHAAPLPTSTGMSRASSPTTHALESQMGPNATNMDVAVHTSDAEANRSFSDQLVADTFNRDLMDSSHLTRNPRPAISLHEPAASSLSISAMEGEIDQPIRNESILAAQGQSFTDPTCMSRISADPATITFSKDTGYFPAFIDFYNFDAFDTDPIDKELEEMEIEQMQSPGGNDKELEEMEMEQMQSPGGNDKMNDSDGESDLEDAESPGKTDIDGESELEDAGSPARGQKRKFEYIDSESDNDDSEPELEARAIPPQSRRRKIDDDNKFDYSSNEPESEDEISDRKVGPSIDNSGSDSESEESGSSARGHKRDVDKGDSLSEPEDIEMGREGDSNNMQKCRDIGKETSEFPANKNIQDTNPGHGQVPLEKPHPRNNRKLFAPRPKARKKTPSLNPESQWALRTMGNSIHNPIDIEAIYSRYEPFVVKEYVEKEDISFLRKAALAKIESTFDLHAFDADGNQTSFKVKAHFPLFLKHIRNLFDHATTDYIDSMPRRLSNPETSLFSVITYETFSMMDPKAIQHKLASKNVVVTGCPHDVNLKFDSQGLRTLTGSMSTQISITDFSIMATPGGNQASCLPSVLSGVVQDLLDHAEDTDSSKILNALDFPLWDESRDANRSHYATDMAAWDVTRGLHVFDPSVLYPTGDVRWGLAGLKNAMTFLHIDPDGFYTENTVGVGGKAWGILRERSGLKTSSTKFYLDSGFSLNEIVDSTQYDFEVIALRPGDRIYMQPNTPHFVFGTHNSICYGGHFYSTLGMQQTLAGLVHSFMLDKFITNTGHQASRQLLRRILIFYLHGLMDKKISSEDRAWIHLPDLEEIEGLMNLLSICALVILGNVLDFRTYTPFNHQPLTKTEKWMMSEFDINGIPTNERLAMCYTRGAALHLFKWVRDCCVIHGPDNSVVEDLPSSFLVQICSAMIRYKRQVEAKDLEGVTGCSLDLLTLQINNIMESKPETGQLWKNQADYLSDSLVLEEQSKYRLEWKAGWETSRSWTSATQDYRSDGCTPFDSKYFEAQAKRVHAEKSRMKSLFGSDKQSVRQHRPK